MKKFMTIDQIVIASRNDVLRQEARGTLKSVNEHCTDNDENVYTITSLYSQWAENKVEAENAIFKMFNEEFSKYL